MSLMPFKNYRDAAYGWLEAAARAEQDGSRALADYYREKSALCFRAYSRIGAAQ